jgi:protein-tyrosine phosphatase
MRAAFYWIDGPWPGRLAIVPRPRGGDWLADEVRSWQQAGLDVVISLLTQDEIVDLDLEREAELCQENGIQFISFPITDRSVPPSQKATLELVRRLDHILADGKSLAIHCRQGVGRSAVITACLLICAGLDPETAFQRISVTRGCAVPETAEQKEWVQAFTRAQQHIHSTFRSA